jgi:DNA transposition AAA+ family ATPase
MIEIFVETKNTVRLSQMYQALARRERGLPGFGLVCGSSGLGKTTAVRQMVGAIDGIYVRCEAMWAPTALCQAIAEGMGLEPDKTPHKTFKAIKDRSIIRPRPLIVDEADYLFNQPRLLDMLRDITDSVDIPIILVGMDGIERKLLRYRQHARRMLRSVEFQPLDAEDFDKFCDRVSEVALAPCLKGHLHQQTKGSIGLAMVGLSQIEKFGMGMPEVTLDDWQGADKQLFLGACV